MKRQEAMKQLKRRLRCPIPLNGMDCQFPNCGCDLTAPSDKLEALAELRKIVSAANVPVRHCPPGKGPWSRRAARSKLKPNLSERSLGPMEMPNVDPHAFVWTKIEAEAGQSIKQILNRKELGRGDDLRIEGIPNGRQIRFKADFWRVGFGRRSTSG
jgi:hypothetical protein